VAFKARVVKLGSRAALKRDAASGVDGLTWPTYEADLDRNLTDLHERVHRGAYRALPSRRVYIPKPDGRQRPLAVAALEDKIVQGATAAVLNAIYEEDFLGFSYGFRRRLSWICRRCHRQLRRPELPRTDHQCVGGVTSPLGLPIT